MGGRIVYHASTAGSDGGLKANDHAHAQTHGLRATVTDPRILQVPQPMCQTMDEIAGCGQELRQRTTALVHLAISCH